MAYAAPAHERAPAALTWLERASNGELTLLLPSICISEARHPLSTKFQVRNEADSVRQETQTGVVLDKMESSVRNDLNRLDERLTELKTVM